LHDDGEGPKDSDLDLTR